MDPTDCADDLVPNSHAYLRNDGGRALSQHLATIELSSRLS